MAKFGDHGEILDRGKNWRPWQNLEIVAKIGVCGENWRPVAKIEDRGDI